MNTEQIIEVVRAVAQERFPGAEILQIDVEEDSSFDDEVVLRVKVVFSAENDKLDTGAKTGFLRHLRPKLSAVGVDWFPVMSFISRNDADAAA